MKCDKSKNVLMRFLDCNLADKLTGIHTDLYCVRGYVVSCKASVSQQAAAVFIGVNFSRTTSAIHAMFLV